MNAHDAILAWCRSKPTGFVWPVMRTRNDGSCVVIDLGQREPKPGGYDWERRDKVLAHAPSWEACAAILGVDYSQGEARDA